MTRNPSGVYGCNIYGFGCCCDAWQFHLDQQVQCLQGIIILLACFHAATGLVKNDTLLCKAACHDVSAQCCGNFFNVSPRTLITWGSVVTYSSLKKPFYLKAFLPNHGPSSIARFPLPKVSRLKCWGCTISMLWILTFVALGLVCSFQLFHLICEASGRFLQFFGRNKIHTTKFWHTLTLITWGNSVMFSILKSHFVC